MIRTWLNGVLCMLSRKRGVPADTIKGVLFFKISKKALPKTKAEKMFRFIRMRRQASVAFIVARKKGRGVLTKGVSFFKIWEGEVCFSKFEKRSFVVKIIERPREFYVSYDTFLHHWCGKGEVKGLIAMASAIKGGLFFKKIEQYISSMYRYKLRVLETLFTR